jgi:hypothetical protein
MNIIQATRAHYAALQHRPGPDRVAIDYEVTIGSNVLPGCNSASDDCSGTVWVRASSNAMRAANLTRLSNRLGAMYPEAKMIHCTYRQ